MSLGRFIRAIVAISWLYWAPAARAEDYVLSFDPASSKFEESLADNRRVISQALALVHDYGGTHGIEFVLIGELPVDCIDDLKCDDAGVLRQRVAAVYDYVDSKSGSSDAARKVRWQPVVSATPHIEGLRIRIRSFASQTYSKQCPYQVLVSDPQLPKALQKDGTDADWVTVIGMDPVPVTDKTAIRVRSASPQAAHAELAASQVFNDHEMTLGSGVEQIEWSATQFKWDEDRADAVVKEGNISRDIGDEILPWSTDSTSSSPISESAADCRISFRLLTPRNQ